MSAAVPVQSQPIPAKRFKVPDPVVLDVKTRALLCVKEYIAKHREVVVAKTYEQNADRKRGLDDQANAAQENVDFNKEVLRILNMGVCAREAEIKAGR